MAYLFGGVFWPDVKVAEQRNQARENFFEVAPGTIDG